MNNPSEQDEKTLNTIRKVLQEVRTKSHTGEVTIKLQTHQGGVTQRRIFLEWIDRT